VISITKGQALNVQKTKKYNYKRPPTQGNQRNIHLDSKGIQELHGNSNASIMEDQKKREADPLFSSYTWKPADILPTLS
jgi:hypothetical protein